MKALSIRAPWWWFILHGSKTIENRDWRTAYRGPVLIHASKTIAPRSFDDDLRCARAIEARHGRWPQPDAAEQWAAMRRGAGCIVGIAEIVDCVEASSSPWFFGRYGLVLRAAAEPCVTPVPCKGALGLFEVPDAVAHAARGALPAWFAEREGEDDPAWLPALHLGGPR